MKSKLFRLSVLFIFLLLFSLSEAKMASAKWKKYPFYNYSGRTVKYLYISSSGYDKWGKDLLGKNILKPGQHVNLQYNDDTVLFDIKIVFAGDDDVYTWSKYNFKSMWRLSLYRDGSSYRINKN